MELERPETQPVQQDALEDGEIFDQLEKTSEIKLNALNPSNDMIDKAPSTNDILCKMMSSIQELTGEL